MTDKINISAEAVAAMLNGVTPGPWAAAGRFVDTHVLQIADLNAGRTGHEDANARFIAWAREAVPALAARLVEVEKSRMDLAGDKINLRSENIALQARAEAAEALLSEAVKAGMLEGAKAANEKETYWNTVANQKRQSGKNDNFACASANSAWRVADDIRALASDPETIARIVAQLKEGRE